MLWFAVNTPRLQICRDGSSVRYGIRSGISVDSRSVTLARLGRLGLDVSLHHAAQSTPEEQFIAFLTGLEDPRTNTAEVRRADSSWGPCPGGTRRTRRRRVRGRALAARASDRVSPTTSRCCCCWRPTPRTSARWRRSEPTCAAVSSVGALGTASPQRPGNARSGTDDRRLVDWFPSAPPSGE